MAPPPPAAPPQTTMASQPAPAYSAPAAAVRAPDPSSADADFPATQAGAEDDESVRVTETLARLADLRDQGAITAEEYEQKKDELLGRL